MANPNLIGGGRYTRAEVSGDTRRLSNRTVSKGALIKRLWRYLGRNRMLLVLALILSFTSSVLALYGPKLSGEAMGLLFSALAELAAANETVAALVGGMMG